MTAISSISVNPVSNAALLRFRGADLPTAICDRPFNVFPRSNYQSAYLVPLSAVAVDFE